MDPHKFSFFCLKKSQKKKKKIKLFVEKKILQILQQFFFTAMADLIHFFLNL